MTRQSARLPEPDMASQNLLFAPSFSGIQYVNCKECIVPASVKCNSGYHLSRFPLPTSDDFFLVSLLSPGVFGRLVESASPGRVVF